MRTNMENRWIMDLAHERAGMKLVYIASPLRGENLRGRIIKRT